MAGVNGGNKIAVDFNKSTQKMMNDHAKAMAKNSSCGDPNCGNTCNTTVNCCSKCGCSPCNCGDC